MGDVDKDEIELDEDDQPHLNDIARLVIEHPRLICSNFKPRFVFSTVQNAPRHEQPTSDDEDAGDRPFTLNDGDELSDDEQLDDDVDTGGEVETPKNQHIRDNFKVDNERGRDSLILSL